MNGVTETYDYDTTGKNRLDQITLSGTTEVLTFSYDDNGNTTTYGDRTLIYNENNRLVEVKEGENTIATYAYNGLGQRLKKTAGGVTTYYVYDQNGQLIAETTSGAVTEYLYMGKIRMAMVDAATGNFYFYLNDRLGTPQLMTYGNSTTVMWEARYKPFGEAVVHPQSGVVNNFRFPGQYFDGETGFHYNYHRYYDPSTGRYLRPDPIGLAGGINLFLYTHNNSINLIDPFGLDFVTTYTQNLRTTNQFFFSGFTRLTRTALGMLTAGGIARTYGTVTPFQAIRSLPNGGIANLGILATFASAGTNTTLNAIYGALFLEGGIGFGSLVNAMPVYGTKQSVLDWWVDFWWNLLNEEQTNPKSCEY